MNPQTISTKNEFTRVRLKRARLRLIDSTRSDYGFTIIEVLFVISIMGIFMAMLVPALLAARGSARRLTCSSNMANLALATHQYELSWRHFPAGAIDVGPELAESSFGPRHNWLSALLPFLDEENRYRKIDFRSSSYSPSNQAIAQLGLPVVRCPSAAVLKPWASSYAGIHHFEPAPISESNFGAFILNRGLTRDDFPDGYRYTILFGEVAGNTQESWLEASRGTLRNMPSPWIATAYTQRDDVRIKVDYLRQQILDDIASSPVESIETNDKQADENEQEWTPKVGLTRDLERLQIERGTTLEDLLALDEVSLAERSGYIDVHFSGSQFAFGDGSVRLFDCQTDVLVLRRLADRRDGELISADVVR